LASRAETISLAIFPLQTQYIDAETATRWFVRKATAAST
jgi:hypothetical protein